MKPAIGQFRPEAAQAYPKSTEWGMPRYQLRTAHRPRFHRPVTTMVVVPTAHRKAVITNGSQRATRNGGSDPGSARDRPHKRRIMTSGPVENRSVSRWVNTFRIVRSIRVRMTHPQAAASTIWVGRQWLAMGRPLFQDSEKHVGCGSLRS